MKARKSLVALAAALVIVGTGWAALKNRNSAADMTLAAQKFLESLSDEELARAKLNYDDPARLDWHFIPKAERKGLQIRDMGAEKRKLAHGLLHTGVSRLGYEKATTIMALEAILHELEKERKDGPIRDPERYYFTVFGEPSAQGRWGWSVEGHHLSLNFAVRDGKLASLTPAFYGANPAEVVTDIGIGPEKGTRVLKQEEVLAFELFGSLKPEQRAVALIAEKAPAELRGAGEPQPPGTAPEGLPASEMSESQRQTLQSLIQAYTDNMPQEERADRLRRVTEAGLEKVYFAWAGADRPGIGHYYRLQGPTFLVEFVNTQPDSLGNPANHIHSVWREMDGDFGVER